MSRRGAGQGRSRPTPVPRHSPLATDLWKDPARVGRGREDPEEPARRHVARLGLAAWAAARWRRRASRRRSSLCAWSILTLREEVVAARPGQWIPHDVVSRVDFAYRDKDLLAHAAAEARRRAPRLQGQPRRRGRRLGAAPPRAAGPPDRLVDPNSLVDGKLAEKLEAAWTAAVTALRSTPRARPPGPCTSRRSTTSSTPSAPARRGWAGSSGS